MIINVLLITDIAGASISTETSWYKRFINYGYCGSMYTNRSFVTTMFGYLWTWQRSKYWQNHHDICRCTIHKHYGSVNINDFQVQKILFFQASSEIYLIFNYYAMNKSKNSYYLRQLELPWKLPSLWCLAWIMKVGLFMIGLTTY